MPWTDPAKRAAYDHARALERALQRRTCPDCGALKHSEESLRAHRGIAHGLLEPA